MHACSRLFCLAILLSLTAMPLCAQTISFPYGEIGGQLGGMYYLGDINNVPFKGTRPAIAAFYRHNFNVRYSAKALLSYGKLTASDSKYKNEFQKARDYSFNRGLVHFSVLASLTSFLLYLVRKICLSPPICKAEWEWDYSPATPRPTNS